MGSNFQKRIWKRCAEKGFEAILRSILFYYHCTAPIRSSLLKVFLNSRQKSRLTKLMRWFVDVDLIYLQLSHCNLGFIRTWLGPWWFPSYQERMICISWCIWKILLWFQCIPIWVRPSWYSWPSFWRWVWSVHQIPSVSYHIFFFLGRWWKPFLSCTGRPCEQYVSSFSSSRF